MLWSTHSLFVAVVLASLLLPTCLAGSQAVARQTGRKCGPPPLEQCSFTDQFKYLNRKRWEVSHDTANGGPFDAWWSKYRVAVRPWNKLDLSISNTPNFNKRFAGAQVMSKRWYGYGCYVVRMKPVSYPGVLSTFFLYTGPYDAAYNRPKKHAEIDIEFVYRREVGRIIMQSNYFARGRGENEEFHRLKFPPQAKFHLYGFKFTSKKIEWYVDGELVRTATNTIPKLSDGPFKIFMNLWVAGPKATRWAGRYIHKKGGVSTLYDTVKYTRGENCKIGKFLKT